MKIVGIIGVILFAGLMLNLADKNEAPPPPRVKVVYKTKEVPVPVERVVYRVPKACEPLLKALPDTNSAISDVIKIAPRQSRIMSDFKVALTDTDTNIADIVREERMLVTDYGRAIDAVVEVQPLFETNLDKCEQALR